MNLLFKKILNRWGGPLWSLLGSLIPKDPQRVVINSFPDFDDTTRALATALQETRGKLTILTTRKNQTRPAWLGGIEAALAYRYSPRGVWLYHRAKFVLFTHGCFSAWPLSKRQVVVNVWHGMPLKRIGLLDGKRPDEIPRFHYTIASDTRFQEILSAAFGVPRERVLIAEHPRLDIIRERSGCRPSGFPPHRKLVVWLPTYRASVVGDVRVDGNESANIFANGADLARIDALCTKHQALCIIKPHPMAKVSPDAFAKYQSLMYIDDQGLAARGFSLYQLLAEADLLITDVSSVYFDYKVVGRPSILYCPDLREYAASRGFVAPLETMVSDEVVETEDALLAKLESHLASDVAGEMRPPRGSDGPSATLRLLHQVGMLT